jgi:hypothetical protein
MILVSIFSQYSFVDPCYLGTSKSSNYEAIKTCDEHPKEMTEAQSVNPRSEVPSEVRILLRQHSTLEISPLITIITADWLQLGLVTRNRLTRLVGRDARVNCW